VVSAGERDPDSEGVEGMSASKMRQAAKDDDFDNFQLGVPKGFKYTQKLFNAVRVGMGLTESKKFRRNIIFDPISKKRDDYINGSLYSVGDTVQIKEGIGDIVVLGSNYVIVNCNSNKHRKWIHDLSLVTQ
jgi:hypothetical protein